MGYAVYHTEKGKVSSSVIGKHIDREPGAEYTFKHADPDRRHLNQIFELNKFCKMPVHEAVEKRISEGYKSKNKAGELKAIRKDAVKYNTHILTGSHEKMKEIEKNPKEMAEWVKANKAFLEREFGKDNIVRFVLHRDEKTPHIHAITVNLTEDGRLSAKDIIGDKKEMQLRQDRYADQMKKFGLERGIRSTGISHEGAREYYARMQDAVEVGNKNQPENVKKSVLGVEFGIDKEKTLEKVKRENTAQKTALKSKDLEIAKLKEQQKKDSEFKIKIIESRQNTEKDLKYSLLSNEYREKMKEIKINEVGKKYGYDVKQKFHFVSHSIQQKGDKEINEMVISAVKKVAEEKQLSSVDTALLMRSKEFKEVEKYLQNERERRNELDQRRGQNRGPRL